MPNPLPLSTRTPTQIRLFRRGLGFIGVLIGLVVMVGLWLLVPDRSTLFQPTSESPPRDTTLPGELPPLVEGLFRVGDARFQNGSWWVLDTRMSAVHQFSEAGTQLGMFGSRGQGPGEFIQSIGISFRGDTLAVLAEGGKNLHLFTPIGRFVTRVDVQVQSCTSFQVWGIREAPTEGYFLSGACIDVIPRPRAGAGVIHVMDSGANALLFSDPELIARGLNPFNFGLVASDAQNVWVASSRSPCVTRIQEAAQGGQQARTETNVCPSEWTGVRFAEVSEAFFGSMRRGEGLRRILQTPEWIPAMTALFANQDEVILQQMTGLDGWDLIGIRPDGSSRVLRAGVPEAVFIEAGRFLLVWEGTEGIHLEFGILDPA